MITEILALAFSATGLFTGASECFAKSDIVTVEVSMRVASEKPRKAIDSISSAINKISDDLSKMEIKKTTITPSAGEEGQTDKYNRELDGDRLKFYAEKSLKMTSKDCNEIESIVKLASSYGFQLNKHPRYEYSKTDSLNAVCVELATNKAIERAKAAQKAMNKQSIKILKVTDSPSFSFYTSDDTMDEDEKIDGFFNNERRIALGAGGEGRNKNTFYSIVPQSIKVSATIKILVQFE